MQLTADKSTIHLQKVEKRRSRRSSSPRALRRLDRQPSELLSGQKVRRNGLVTLLQPSSGRRRRSTAAEQQEGSHGRQRRVQPSLRARFAGLGRTLAAGGRLSPFSLLIALLLLTAAGAVPFALAGGGPELIRGNGIRESGFWDGGFWSSGERGIDLPGTSAAERELLAWSSVEPNGQGSGDLRLPDRPQITNVGTETYRVKEGDTLSEIASRHGIEVGTLIGFNGISDVRRVMAGSTLKIPDMDGVPYTVKRGDSLEGIAASFNVPLADLLDANDLQTALIKPGQELFVPGAEISEYKYRRAMGTLFVYPSQGRLTSGFGYRIDPFTGIRRMHYGIDLASEVGTPVRSTMEGTVAVTGNQPRGYGKYVVVKHRYGYQSLYGHLHSIEVRRGQHVAQGQRLGSLGNSGRSTGPHLHFSIYKNNAPVDPLDRYLR
jgi:murein DD-endopeptidase MepM/ murein hydrolase activator NlpD